MIVRAPEEKFATAPEGTFPAVCVDVIDLGIVPNRYDPEQPARDMVRFIWQLDEHDESGKPYYVRNDYTASLHEKAKLRKHLEAWRGRAFTQQELLGFDTEQVIGTGCLISIVHNSGSRGGVFANVGAVMKLARGMSAPRTNGYIRVKDRPVETPKPQAMPQRSQRRVEQEPPEYAQGITDDDVPF